MQPTLSLAYIDDLHQSYKFPSHGRVVQSPMLEFHMLYCPNHSKTGHPTAHPPQVQPRVRTVVGWPSLSTRSTGSSCVSRFLL